MNTNRKLFTVAVIGIALSVASAAQARDFTGGGSQTRGQPGRNAELRSDPVTLPAGCFIQAVDSIGMDGFWMEGQRKYTFVSGPAARGAMVEGGQYRIYPELRSGVMHAKVTVTFRCP